MSESATHHRASRTGLRATAGVVLTRLVVPGWILAGAFFKYQSADPRLLPSKTVLPLTPEWLPTDDPLAAWLAILITAELFLALVMLLLPCLARLTAAVTLGVFCAVLLGEMVQGNLANCGCLGASSPPPWVMLAIDLTLLAGVLFIFPPARRRTTKPLLRIALIAVLGGIGAWLTWQKVNPPPPQRQPAACAPSDSTPLPMIAQEGTIST